MYEGSNEGGLIVIWGAGVEEVRGVILGDLDILGVLWWR